MRQLHSTCLGLLSPEGLVPHQLLHPLARLARDPRRMWPALVAGLLLALLLPSLAESMVDSNAPGGIPAAARRGARPTAAVRSTTKYSSSAITITPDGNTLLVVNPDSNSLSLVDTAARSVIQVPVGVDPRSVAVSPDGQRAYVANQGSNSISVVSVPQARVTITATVGYRPVGVAISPDGHYVAVAELGDDRVRLLDAVSLAAVDVVAVPDRPCGLAFAPHGDRLLVTHLLSGDVTIISLRPFALYLPVVVKAGTILPEKALSALDTPGFPVTLVPTWPQVAPAPAVAVNAAGTRAYLPQTMAHGQGLNTQFDTTVFAKISVLNLESRVHQTSEHISLPEKDQPVGLPWDVALARADRELWVVNAASNDVSVLDISDPQSVRRTAHIPVADNPRGIVMHPDGGTAYVNNTLAGTVSVIDTALYTVTAVITTTAIPLPPALLHGKRLFHSSALPELSQARWISCNTCHIEGEHDGRTWLLQYTGEVPPGASAIITRNTTSLLGMVETYPLRWSAEWDESADSEFSIRFEQFGTGLIQGVMHPTLGDPNQGRSWDLDCLASYIDSLSLPPPRVSPLYSPLLTTSVSSSGEGPGVRCAPARGRELFNSPRTGCSLCHPAPLYTDQRQHDVGTASSYGEWFGPLIDTPSLRLLYDSAPYLHNGSAATLLDVLTTANPDDKHGMTSGLTQQELEDLVAFMLALPEPAGAESFTYETSSCLGEPTRGPGHINVWVEGHDIIMAHTGAIYNCCAQLVVYLDDETSFFKLIEQEEYPDRAPCRCQCAYDLGARIANLPAGTYQVQVWSGTADTLLADKTVQVE